jgi:superfamily I DNA and RNA helicase
MRFPPFADLDKDQRNIYVESPIDGAILVTGPPGTGKTVIAMHRALRLSGDKRNVSIVMFNKVLCRYTSNFENLPNNIDVKHMHKWASGWLRSIFQNKIPKIDKFTFDWKRISEIIMSCEDKGLIEKMSWGHLIVDEGQDFDVGMYKALMNVVRHPLMDEHLRPTLTVFADENQTIFSN